MYLPSRLSSTYFRLLRVLLSLGDLLYIQLPAFPYRGSQYPYGEHYATWNQTPSGSSLQFGLTQHVAVPHALGGWRDVIMTRNNCNTSDLTVEPPSISDQGLLCYTMPLLLSLRLLSVTPVVGDALMERCSMTTFSTAHSVVTSSICVIQRSNSSLMLFFRYVQHRTQVRSLQPWLDQHCWMLRRNVRRLERRYRHTNLTALLALVASEICFVTFGWMRPLFLETSDRPWEWKSMSALADDFGFSWMLYCSYFSNPRFVHGE